ncbi:MAG: putative DNA binding domain-containing protein [Simkania negevensis]|nr:putative DNA binding domain-containing protein [Simkania negevensis]
MELGQLKEIISRGEDSRHQFKEDVRNADALAAEMVAFSNSQGGQIFIGVSNHGTLTGLSSEDAHRINQLISNTASQHIRSPIAVYTENIAVSRGRIIIVLTISEGIDKPYFDHQGVIWLKSGADKRRVHSKEELQRLFQEVDLIHADEVPTRAGMEALNSPFLLDFLKKVYHEILPKSNVQRIRLLENMNLAHGHRLNLAGLLLFGQKPQVYKPECVIKAVCFPGTEIANHYLDSEDFEGSLPNLFQGALTFIMRNLRKLQKQKGVNSLGESEIPQIVFEELLVNSLIHRDYFISAPIRLFVFDDRIEIINPGHLPNHLTVEKIQTGNSVQRNPILASFAAKGLLPYRGLGTGVRRALEGWPNIRFINDREGSTFISVVERIKVEGTYDKWSLKEGNGPINGPINGPLSDMQILILNALHKNASISYEEIAAQLGKSRNTVKRHIQQLKLQGILNRLGSKKKGYWQIVASLKE